MSGVFELLTDVKFFDWLIYPSLFLAGAVAYALSLLTGGGGSLLLVPVANATIGINATAPVINLGALVGRPARLVLFWRSIHWRLVAFYAPAAVLGAVMSGYFFSRTQLDWLHLGIGVFLISTVFQFRMGEIKQSFPMPLWGFAPLGLLVSMIGTLVGAIGPVLNPFYINAGLDKHQLTGTKTMNSFLMGLSQITSYTLFGLLTPTLWAYGLTLGAGAVVGNLVGKRWLDCISDVRFKQGLVVFMVFSGVLMVSKVVWTWLGNLA